MGVFLYYIPGTPDVSKPASVFNIMPFGETPLNKFARCGCKGPDGKNGFVFSHAPDGVKVITGYYSETQEWVEVMGIWIGFYKDDPPKPEHLMRPANEMISGHNVNGWMVPIARVYPDGTNLPESFVLNDSGEWESEIKAEFLNVSKRCETAWEIITRQDDVELPNENFLVDLAVDAIAINYYVSKYEISAAKLLDSHIMRHVIFALVDWFTAIKLLKLQNESVKKKTNPKRPIDYPSIMAAR